MTPALAITAQRTHVTRSQDGAWTRRQPQLSPNRFHRILQVIGRLDHLPDADPLARARAIVLDWLRNRKGGFAITDALATGPAPVEIEVEDSTRALFIESAPGLWAVRLNDPCSQVPGRQWRVELVLVDMKDGLGPAFGCTLSVLVPAGNDGMVGTPGKPTVIGQLAQTLGLSDGGFRLDGTVWEVDRPADIDRLVAFIEAPVRKVPVVAVSTPRQGDVFVEADRIANGLAGLALVVVLSADAAQEITERYGRALGVFGNAVRMYRVGFDADIDTWQRHPLYTAPQWSRRIPAIERNLKLDAMDDSVSTRDESRDLPSFSFIRRIASDQRVKALAAHAGESVDVSGLETEISRLQREVADWEKMALDEEKNAAHAIDAQNQTKARLLQFTARIDDLEAKLSSLGGQTREPNPESFDELGEWAARNLSGHLVITPKALRAAQRSHHEDVSHVYDCVYALGTTYRAMRRGHVTKGECDDAMATLGVRITPTGRAVETARFEGEYSTMWEGRRYKLNMHLAGSASRKEQFGLRIYFAWDDEQELVVVGQLPEHLTNSLS